MGVQVTNNAFSTLSGGIDAVVTSMSVQAGHGARFPAASVASGNYFYVTLIDASNNVEIVKVTDRTVDTFTIVRASDGTTAQAFALNDRVELRPVAALFIDLLAAMAAVLAFPATQVPSANPNTLDDYEEGTWTPGMSFNGSSTGVTYSAQAGEYVKIGRFVKAFGIVTLTNNGSGSGAARITGFPFVASSGSQPPTGTGELVAGGTSALGIRPRMENGTANAYLTIPNASTDVFATQSNCGNSFSYIFEISYMAAD